jgi:hypothetical protein
MQIGLFAIAQFFATKQKTFLLPGGQYVVMSAKNLNPWGSICRNVIIFLTILGGQFPEMGGQFASE